VIGFGARLRAHLDKNYQTEANRRLAKHLDHEFPYSYLFTFLHCPEMEATNNRAERAIRHACHLQGKDSFVMLVDLWRNPQSNVLEVLPGSYLRRYADAQVTE
jgi:hypothetical protein